MNVIVGVIFIISLVGLAIGKMFTIVIDLNKHLENVVAELLQAIKDTNDRVSELERITLEMSMKQSFNQDESV